MLIRRFPPAFAIALLLFVCMRLDASPKPADGAYFVTRAQSVLPQSSRTRGMTRTSGRFVVTSRSRLKIAARKTLAQGFVSPVIAYAAPPIEARAAILMDMRSGSVLFAKDPDVRLPMASTTKIATAILVLRHARLHDLVTVSRRAATVGESTMGLQKGERVTVLQLLYGLMLNSGNDAAIALAEHVGRTVEQFVRMMNDLATELHVHNTHFSTPHGLDAPNHYTSARDLSKFARYAMRSREFRRIVATPNYFVPATRHNHAHWLASINHVMFWYPGVDGVKPGSTDAAGLCQVVSVHRDGRDLLAVLLNTPTLVNDIRNLLNYGLHDFRWVQAPAWWDSPANRVSGGSASRRWAYYYGAGHYIRGAFLSYFDAHGGLQTLGYPRTEQFRDHGQIVQYFQGGLLRYDTVLRALDKDSLGAVVAQRVLSRSLRATSTVRVASLFRREYRVLGGRAVLGAAITPLVTDRKFPTQYFQYSQLALIAGAAVLSPVGDAELRIRGWLPASGAANSYPPNFNASLIAGIQAPIPQNADRRN